MASHRLTLSLSANILRSGSHFRSLSGLTANLVVVVETTLSVLLKTLKSLSSHL